MAPRWICHWNPVWVQDDGGFRKAYSEEWEPVAPATPHRTSHRMINHSGTHLNAQSSIWVAIKITLSQNQEESFACLTQAVSSGAQKPTDDGWSTPSGSPPTPPGLPSSPQSSWQPYTNASTAQGSWAFRLHVPQPPNEPVTLKPLIPEVIHPIQCGSTPQRLLLPRSDIEILTLFDDDTSSIRDDHTAWVTAGPTTIRARHMTNKGNAAPVFWAAFEKACLSFLPEYRFTRRPNRQLEQTRISILSWNPRPRRGTPGASEKHIAGKWHIIAVQEAIEYLQHDSLTNHFHISHHAGCAVLFNKDTFYPDVRVSSVDIHDTKNGLQEVIREGEAGRVFQAVVSRAAFRRVPRDNKPFFTMMSVHINTHYAKKRGIAKNVLFAVRTVMCQEQVDMVAGDFNGATWRKKSGDNQQRHSTIEEAFANTNLPIPYGSSPLWGSKNVPAEWADVRGFIEPPNTDNEWQIRGHGAFEINRDILGIRPTDQSCRHEVWIHLSHANARLVDQYRTRNDVRSEQDRRQGKTRYNPYDHM